MPLGRRGGRDAAGPVARRGGVDGGQAAPARHFQRHGVPTPETTPARDLLLPNIPAPFVLKHRFGAGSHEMMICTDESTADDLVSEAAGIGELILQPLVFGLPASVSFLIGPRRTHVLPPAEQFVSLPGNFRYLGGQAPLPALLAERAVRIARRAVEVVDGLAGYVGVDVVLGDAGDHVIEINPRLTTSYVGLRVLAADNLMDVLRRLVRGESVATPRWRGRRSLVGGRPG